MFYTQVDIDKALKCSLCTLKLYDPRVLPCGNTICGGCVIEISVTNPLYSCSICKVNHIFDGKVLPRNEAIEILLAAQKFEVSRGDSHNNCIRGLREIDNRLNLMNKLLNNSELYIHEYCSELKDKVQLAGEMTFQKLQVWHDHLLTNVEVYEKDLKESAALNYSI